MNNEQYLKLLQSILIKHNVNNAYSIIYQTQQKMDNYDLDAFNEIFGSPNEYAKQFINDEQFQDSSFLKYIKDHKERDTNNLYAIIIIVVLLFNSSFDALNIFPWAKPITSDFSFNKMIINVIFGIVILTFVLKFVKRKK